MPTWTQPADFIRQEYTDIEYGERADSLTVRFKAAGRCEMLADGTRRFVHADTGAVSPLPSIGDTPVVSPVAGAAPVTYSGRFIKSVSARSFDNAESEITLVIAPVEVSVTFSTPAQVDELEWVQHSDPVQGAPRYRDYLIANQTISGKTQTRGKWFKDWLDASGADAAIALYDAFPSGLKELCDRYAAGLRDYIYWAPVVRRTNRATAYASGSAGAFESPPMSSPSGYTYRKTAARSIRQGEAGTWETSQEWSGYKHAYTDLDTPL